MANNTTTAITEDDFNLAAEQVEAIIERARSVVEADNAEGLKDLETEMETIVSKFPSRGKAPNGKTWTETKKDMRNAFRAAATVQEKPVAKVVEGTVTLATTDYHSVEGVDNLVAKGARQFAEGVKVHLKSSELAKSIALVLLNMRVRMLNKDGVPDILAEGAGPKAASKDMYAAAGEAFMADSNVSRYDAEQAIRKLQKSVQNHMPTVRAEYLRSLDEDKEEAARFELITSSDKSKGMSVSEAVAAYYGVELVSRYELEKARFEAKELEAGEKKNGGNGEDEGDGDEGLTEEQKVLKALQRAAETAMTNANKASKLDDDGKAHVKAYIQSLITDLATASAAL